MVITSGLKWFARVVRYMLSPNAVSFEPIDLSGASPIPVKAKH